MAPRFYFLFDFLYRISRILNRFLKQCFIQRSVEADYGFFAVQADLSGGTVDFVDGFGNCIDAVLAVHAGNFNNFLSDDRIFKLFFFRRKASTAASAAGSLTLKMLNAGSYAKQHKDCNNQNYNDICHDSSTSSPSVFLFYDCFPG